MRSGVRATSVDLESAIDLMPARGRGRLSESSWLMVGTAAAQGLTAVAYLLTARTMTAAQYGIAMSQIGLAITIAGLVDFGSNAFAAREISAGRLAVRPALGRLYAKLMLLAVAVAAATMLSGLIGHRDLPTLAVGMLAVWTAATMGLQSIIRALGHLRWATSVLVVERLALLAGVGTCLLVEVRVRPGVLVSISVATTVLSTAVGLITLRDRGIVARPNHPFRGSLHFGVSAALTSVQAADVPLIGLFAGRQVAGGYAGVARWTTPMNLIANTWVQGLTPSLAAAGSHAEAMRIALRSSRILVLSWGASILVALLSPWLVRQGLGENYTASIIVLQLLAIATIPASVGQLAATFLQCRGFDRRVAGIMAIFIPAQLLLMGGLAAAISVAGAGLALLVSQLLLATTLTGFALASVRRESSHDQGTVS